MGFLDSFNKSAEKALQEEKARQKASGYRTVKARESERFNALSSKINGQSDGVLLSKMRSSFTSDEEKQIIDKVLRDRGYRRAANGTYHR